MSAQFITIESILDSIQLQSDFGDATARKERYQLKDIALQGVREIDMMLSLNVMSIVVDVEDGDASFPIPDNFIDYVGLYAYDRNNYLVPLAVNKRISVSLDPILDQSGDPILDQNGEMIYGTGPTSGNSNQGFINDYTTGNSFSNERAYSRTSYGSGGGANAYGYYKLDTYSNEFKIELRSDVTKIVLDYVADSMTEINDVVIPVQLRETMVSYINWKAIQYTLNVTERVKERAQRDYYREKKIAKRKMNRFRLEEWLYSSSKNQMQALKF